MKKISKDKLRNKILFPERSFCDDISKKSIFPWSCSYYNNSSGVSLLLKKNIEDPLNCPRYLFSFLLSVELTSMKKAKLHLINHYNITMSAAFISTILHKLGLKSYAKPMKARLLTTQKNKCRNLFECSRPSRKPSFSTPCSQKRVNITSTDNMVTRRYDAVLVWFFKIMM